MWTAIRWPPGCPTVRRTHNEHRVPVDTIASGAIGNVIAMNLCVSMGD
jgi:hypothetical protein